VWTPTEIVELLRRKNTHTHSSERERKRGKERGWGQAAEKITYATFFTREVLDGAYFNEMT